MSQIDEGPVESMGKKYHLSTRASIFILVVLTLLYILSNMDQQLLAVVLELVKADLGLTDAQAGSLQTILLLSTSLLSIPCALLVDRWSRRKGIALMAIFWSVAHFASGLGTRFAHIATARFFTGVGESGFVPGSTSWISFIFPKEKRARIMGLYLIGLPLGLGLGVAFGGALAQATGSWRTPFYVFAVPGIILGIITWFLPDYATVKKNGKEKSLNKEYFREVLRLFKIKTLVLHWIGVVFLSMMLFGFLAWYPALLMRGYGLNVADAGKIVGLAAIVGMIGTPVGGLLSDLWQKFSRRGRMLFLSLLALLVGLSKCCLLASIGTSLQLTILLVLIDGFIAPMTGVLVYTINADVTPRRQRSTSAGMQVLFTFLCGGAWGPVIIGALSDSMGGGASGLVKAGFILTLAGALSCIAFLVASRSYPADSERVSDEVFMDED